MPCVTCVLSAIRPFLFTVIILDQVCKYPERTKRRKKRLSSEEYASTQIAHMPNTGYDDEREFSRRGPRLGESRDEGRRQTELGEGHVAEPPVRPPLNHPSVLRHPISKRASHETKAGGRAKRARADDRLPLALGGLFTTRK